MGWYASAELRTTRESLSHLRERRLLCLASSCEAFLDREPAMHLVIFLWASLAVGDVTEYTRPLGAKKLDQATFDAETYGEKKSIKREDGGLHITLPPGEVETGWKTPQAVRLGGDFTILADFEVKKLPKPAQEDGVAVGASIATQNLDQPEATLVRLTEMDGSTV
jgi:hypothetical protein